MRRIFIVPIAIVVVLALAAVAALTVLPRLIGWEQYRPEIAARFHAATGLTLTIDGPVALSLLPSPRLRLSAVSIANPRDRAAAILRIATLDIELAPIALFEGRIEARSVVLRAPILAADRLAEAQVDWAKAAADRADIWPLGIDRLEIVGGTILYPQGSAGVRLDDVTATALLPGLDQPLRVDGSLRWRGQAVSIAASSARPAPDGRPVSLEIKSGAATLRFDGTVADAAAPTIAGNLHILGPSLRAAASELGATGVGGWPDGSFSAAARVAAESGGMRLDAIDADFAGGSVTGRATLVFGAHPHFAAQAKIGQLDLDGSRPAMLAGWTFPPSWRGTLDATADAVIWHQDAARQITARLSLAGGRVIVDRLSALLPGGSQITVSNSGNPSGSHAAPEPPSTEGRMTLSSDNFRALLRWVGVSIVDVPPDHLRRARLSAQFKLGADDAVDIAPLTVDLDDTALTGSLHFAAGAHPVVAAQLAVGALNLDGYLPGSIDTSAIGAGLAAIKSLDARLDATIATLVVRGRPLRQVHLAATLAGGVVTITDLHGSGLGGATARLSGTLAESGARGAAMSGQFDCAGPDLQPVLLQLFPGWSGDSATGPFTVAGKLDIADQAIKGSARLSVLGGNAVLDGTITLTPKLAISGEFSLDHPHYAALVKALGAGAATEAGPLHIAARLAGTPGALTLDPLSLTAGASRLAGKATLSLGPAPDVSADLAGNDLVLDGLIPSGAAGGFGFPPIEAALNVAADSLAYDGWKLTEPRLTLSARGGTIAVRDFSAGFLSGEIGGGLTYARVGAGHLALTLHLDDAELGGLLTEASGGPVITGRADADLSASADGGTVAALVGSLAGTAKLRVHDGALSGIDLKAVAAELGDGDAKLAGRAGATTPYTTLTGDFAIADGIVRSRDLQLTLADGTARGSLAVDLPNRQLTVGLAMRLSHPVAAPPVMLLLAGPLSRPRRSFDFAALASYAKVPAPLPR